MNCNQINSFKDMNIVTKLESFKMNRIFGNTMLSVVWLGFIDPN
jgi:hypothetical protein